MGEGCRGPLRGLLRVAAGEREAEMPQQFASFIVLAGADVQQGTKGVPLRIGKCGSVSLRVVRKHRRNGDANRMVFAVDAVPDSGFDSTRTAYVQCYRELV